MNQSLIINKQTLPPLLHLTGRPTDLPLPFAREIFLLDCHIAGTSHRENLAEIEPNLKIGSQLRLQREPENEFDELAIAVYDTENNKLGYVPKAKNEVLARLLDAGKKLFARLTNKQWNGAWLKLELEIFMQD